MNRKESRVNNQGEGQKQATCSDDDYKKVTDVNTAEILRVADEGANSITSNKNKSQGNKFHLSKHSKSNTIRRRRKQLIEAQNKADQESVRIFCKEQETEIKSLILAEKKILEFQKKMIMNKLELRKVTIQLKCTRKRRYTTIVDILV